MPTVADVWRAVFPLAVPSVAPPHREVGWVRVLKARVPAFDALEAADLAILPAGALQELATGPLDATGVVDAIAGAGGSAVLVVGGASHDAVASQALERAAAAGMGAFSMAHGDATSLERSVIGYLVNGRAELERQAAVLEAELERIALAGQDLDSHAAAIARFVGRAVAIEQPRGRPLAVHAPADVPSAVVAAARYLARPRAAALRVRLPDSAGEPGALVLLGTDPPSELERVAAKRVAGLLALELRRSVAGVDARPEARSGAPGLPADGPPWVSIVARQVRLDRPSPMQERERLRVALRRLGPARRLALRGDAASMELRLVAVADGDDPLALAVAGRVATLAERPVAVSRPFRDPEQRALAEAEARVTLEASEDLPDQPFVTIGRPEPASQVVRADRLPVYRLLGALHDIPDGLRQARALLGPLLQGRAARVDVRLATLRAVLDAPGLSAAAAVLGLHRNTLSYRIDRIESSTGWNLEDPALRVALGMALRIVRSAQDEGIPEPSLTHHVLPGER